MHPPLNSEYEEINGQFITPVVITNSRVWIKYLYKWDI